jgi:hypothetical protein
VVNLWLGMGIGGALFGSSSKSKVGGGGGVVAPGDAAGDGLGLTAAGGLFGVTTGAGELKPRRSLPKGKTFLQR